MSLSDPLPEVVPALPRAVNWNRDLTLSMPFAWLAAGWRDFSRQPGGSLLFGIALFALSLVIVAGLFMTGYDYLLFPALASFLIIAPIFAIGLYEKSRLLERGVPATLGGMMVVKAESGGGQILFTGVLLAMVMLLWVRAAVLIYALFFGMVAFPGLDHIAEMLFYTPTGWAMLVVGTAVGGLFAAFGFAISVFAIPMLLDEKRDAFTAMGSSIALVWNNLPVMILWGAIVLVLLVLALLPGMIGLIVVYPILGHATWHAWRAVRRP